MPDYAIESGYAGPVVGLDEAGRGCLAGPVVAACAFLDPGKIPPALLSVINDSKKLSEPRRVEVAGALRKLPSDAFASAFARVEAAEIDRINILNASLKAMEIAYSRLCGILPRPPVMALVDGNRPPAIDPCRCIVGGDSKSLSVAAASIIAKVEKDRALGGLGARFPVYGFAANKGYPTAGHIKALNAFGPCPAHRKTYAPVARLIASA
ncbi:MAG: ribonuclease HII [Rickettsiales bacterium]|nr:ribonuclease HII [Rickettsiales bacterium]